MDRAIQNFSYVEPYMDRTIHTFSYVNLYMDCTIHIFSYVNVAGSLGGSRGVAGVGGRRR